MSRSEEDVLRMSEHLLARSMVRRHYMKWRKRNGLPDRCDNPGCVFHTSPLVWNGLPLNPILDHVSGNARDNTPDNLRLLCPNCDAQNTKTRGGANAGRIEVLPGGSYHARNRDGTQDAFANGARVVVAVSLAPGAATTKNPQSMPAQGQRAADV
jgi:hypothetical protein